MKDKEVFEGVDCSSRRCICELNFKYTAKIGGYANMSLDIPKLSAMLLWRLIG